METRVYFDVLIKTVKFMRLNYIHLLPFSFVLFVLLLLVGFISTSSNKISLLVLLVISPLLFSFAVYVYRTERFGETTWRNFLHIYAHSYRFYLLHATKYLLFLIALLPMVVALQYELANFQFDLESFYEAEKVGDYLPSPHLYLATFFSVTLTMLCYPFVIFPEYFYIFEKMGLVDAYKKSFDLAKRNYFSLLFLMVFQVLVFSLGSFLSCGFLFVLALPFFSILTYYIYESQSLQPSASNAMEAF